MLGNIHTETCAHTYMQTGRHTQTHTNTQVLSDLKDHEGAMQHWNAARTLAADVDTFISLGLTASTHLRDDAGALQYLRAGQQVDPHHPFPYVAAATVYMRAGDHATAACILKHVSQPLDVGSAHYHDVLRVDPAAARIFLLPTMPPMPHTPARCSRTCLGTAASTPAAAFDPAGAAVAGGAAAPPGSARSAVVYLTSDSGEDLADLRQSLILLHKHYFLPHGPRPVIIFHDNLQEHHKEQLLAAVPALSVTFALVDLAVPAETTRVFGDRVLKKYLGYGLGYRSMCRFFSGPMYDHPALAQADYYMRLDVDSFFLAPLPLDPLQHLVAGSLDYGYMATGVEEDKFARDLWPTMAATAQGLGLDTALREGSAAVQGGGSGVEDREYVWEGQRWDKSFVYTNFEVSTAVWHSEYDRQTHVHVVSGYTHAHTPNRTHPQPPTHTHARMLSL